jgi:hypothetical protein
MRRWTIHAESLEIRQYLLARHDVELSMALLALPERRPLPVQDKHTPTLVTDPVRHLKISFTIHRHALFPE